MQRRTIRQQLGTTLVEVLVAIALSGIVLPVLATALVTAHAGRATSVQSIQATSLLHEAENAVRDVREKGWSNVTTNGTYHPSISGSTWALTSGSESINGFTRQIVISDVQRDSSLAIVNSGGTIDPNTKHVVITVSWTKPTNASVSAESFLGRWQKNAAWAQSTQTDFTGGTLTNTCATTTCDQLLTPNNNVQLADEPATWQLPSIIGSFDITGSVSGLTVYEATVNSVPYAFVGYSGGLAIINVSNPAAPTLTTTVTAYGQVNGVFVVGTTLYLATSSNTAELVTMTIASLPTAPTQQDTINLGGTEDANTVFVSGGFAYVGKTAAGGGSNEFYIVNVSTPTNITQTSTFTRLGADINSICVNAAGTVAYLATAQSGAQLRILNISTKTLPINDATVNLGVTANKLDCSSGTNVYIATQANGSASEVRVYNVTTPTAPTAVGTGFEVGSNVIGLDIDPNNPNYLILATQASTKQAIILNISTPASITLVNNVNVGSNLNKVMINGAFAYFGSTNTSQELTILYTGYRPSGTFESSTFDATANAGFNHLVMNATVPAGTTLTFQVGANSTNSGWTYEGSDGTSGTSYTATNGTTTVSIPLNIASNRYFRYKATFAPSANGQLTPAINDVTLNYSP